jgi:ATP-dependent Lon protease
VDVVVFPRVLLTLIIKREKTLQALNFAMQHDQLAVCVAQRKDSLKEVGQEDIYSVGTVAKIREVAKQPDGSVRIVVEGLVRAKITEFVATDPFLKVRVDPMPEPGTKKTERIEAWTKSLVNQFKECVTMGANVPFEKNSRFLSPTALRINWESCPWRLGGS